MNKQENSPLSHLEKDRYSPVIFFFVSIALILFGTYAVYLVSPHKVEIAEHVKSVIKLDTNQSVVSYFRNMLTFFGVIPLIVFVSVLKLVLWKGGIKLTEFKRMRMDDEDEFAERTALRWFLFSVLVVIGVMCIGNAVDRLFNYDPILTTSLRHHVLWVLAGVVYSLLLRKIFNLVEFELTLPGLVEMLYVFVFDPIRCLFSKSEFIITLLYFILSILPAWIMILFSDLFQYSFGVYTCAHLYFFLMYQVLASVWVHIQLYRNFMKSH